MAQANETPGTSFWRRWIHPRLKDIFLTDWTLWTSLAIAIALIAFPLISSSHLLCGVTVEAIGGMVISFSAIGLGISLALGALVATFPSGKLRTAMQSLTRDAGRSAFSDLAFVAFWAGFSNLLAATLSFIATIAAGPYSVLEGPDLVPAIASSVMLGSALYALLQMLSALVALLEAAGLAEKFQA